MTRPRGSAVLAALLAVSAMSGCGGVGLSPAAPVTPPVAPTAAPSGTAAPTTGAPSAGATPTQGTAPDGTAAPSSDASGVPDTVARMTGGNGSALPLLVATSALPSGWTATQARDTRGYRMTVCGVDLEPTEPVDGAQQNWQKSAGGPYLEQHVRVYPDATASKVVAALAKKVPGCRTYTAKDATGKSTFAVEKLALKGAPSGTVAWRQRVPLTVPGPVTGTATASPTTVEVVQDVAVRRAGAAVVLMNAYAVGTEPDDAILVKALTSVG